MCDRASIRKKTDKAKTRTRGLLRSETQHAYAPHDGVNPNASR
jgi:hypothetical protein